MITTSCTECKAKSRDGILEHLKTCTAAKPTTYTLESRMPAMQINFDTPEEQAEWLRKLNSGQANGSVNPQASSEAIN